MKFSVGYQFFAETCDYFAPSICSQKEHIDEVYFPWLDTQTCRESLSNDRGAINWQAQTRLESDIKSFKENGIKLNLLLNSNCYGERAVSDYFKNYICSIVDHIQETAKVLDTVTTTSPFAAWVVKRFFPEVKTRASVNMRIGTIQGIKHVADLFDGFYLQREFNRNMEYIRDLKKWLDNQGKTLHLLANSGCMQFCSWQIFHDNAVGHENGIKETQNINEFNTAGCWSYYKNQENWVSLLQNTWIRPEDLDNYAEFFRCVKLATRSSSKPLAVIKAYIDRRYDGNLLDLLEPNHTSLLSGYYIDNRAFPEDWFHHTSNCSGYCDECGYCKRVMTKVLKKIPASK